MPAGTYAAIERIFSITNVLWTDEKNRFLVPTIKAVIILKNNFKKYSCNDFFGFFVNLIKIIKRNQFIKKIRNN